MTAGGEQPGDAAATGPHTPLLEHAALERLREWGGDALLGRMVSLFLELGPQRVETLTQALSDGDLEVLERTAHSLKSSSGNVGASRLSARAAELETAARTAGQGGSREGLTELVATIGRSWEETAEALGRALPPGAAPE